MLARPGPDEYNPYYARYVELVPDGDIVTTLASQIEETDAVVRAFIPGREDFRYEPGKWSVRESLGHVVDTERVFGFRALWFARGAAESQPGMDQDLWVAGSNAGERALDDLLSEWRAVRASTVALFRSLDPEAGQRSGVASGYPVTVRALAWITAGHELHHRALFRERYGSTA
ncbi:MAG: DinB family protein [Gemmatimonadota bacterium]|nr:DinB family protein [Gemmatimonadota bacterium]